MTTAEISCPPSGSLSRSVEREPISDLSREYLNLSCQVCTCAGEISKPCAVRVAFRICTVPCRKPLQMFPFPPPL